VARKKETGLFKRAGAEVYQYDFWLCGHRFHGTTGCTERREAEAFVRARKAEALASIDKEPASVMTFGAASSRWWQEVGQHLKRNDTVMTNLARLQREIGMNTPLTRITGDMVARIVAKRRNEGISPSTVNRSVTEPLRKIIRRAGEVWEVETAKVQWSQHILREPAERVRELSITEQEAIFARLGEDYLHPVRFALLSGCRLNEVVTLEWSAVDWGNRRITISGKTGIATIPLSAGLRAVLWPLQGRHDKAVFCYRANDAWLPITYSGLSSAFRRARAKAGIQSSKADPVAGLRFHDLRHTTATRVLRATGNLKLVQKLLRHTRIETTTRYAHVMDEEVSAAMDAASAPERKAAQND